MNCVEWSIVVLLTKPLTRLVPASDGEPMPGGADLYDRSALASGDALPLYLQLARHLRRNIVDGSLAETAALPSERDLADRFGVSRVTVRKALHELSQEGLLRPRQGAGTFVASPPHVEQRLSALTSFSEDMASRGLKSGSKWLSRTVGAASSDEVLALGLTPGETVCRLRRLRLADGAPMAEELAVVPTRYLPHPDEIGASLYEALRARGHAPHRALQRLKAIQLTPERAALLEAPVGSAALYIERRSLLRDGSPVEFVRSHYRGDAYDFVVELSLSPPRRGRPGSLP
jgi:GntR family transcriptional regulator